MAGITELPFIVGLMFALARSAGGWQRCGEVVFADTTDADYKRTLVERLQAEGQRIAYVGDGLTDREAAAAADLVFARRKLLEHCQAAGLACIPFEDFRDVQRGLEASIGDPAS